MPKSLPQFLGMVITATIGTAIGVFVLTKFPQIWGRITQSKVA